jgi:hypothetical protein
MSRSYEFRVMVRGYKSKRIGEICAALQAQWDFDPSEFPGTDEAPAAELNVSGVDDLTGGLAADEMAARLAHAAGTANGAYREVAAWSTFLDVVPPSDTHTWTEGDHQEWLDQGGQESDERDGQVQGAHGVPGAQRAGEGGRAARQLAC